MTSPNEYKQQKEYFKRKIIELGWWNEAVSYREWLKREHEFSPQQAWDKTMLDFQRVIQGDVDDPEKFIEKLKTIYQPRKPATRKMRSPGNDILGSPACLRGKVSTDVEVDVWWIFNALGDKHKKPDDCPSAAAWAWWGQLRNDPKEALAFRKQWVPLLFKQKPTESEEEVEVDGIESQLGGMLAETGARPVLSAVAEDTAGEPGEAASDPA